MNLYNVTFFSDVEFNISKNFHSLLYEMKENRMWNVNMNRFIQKLYTGMTQKVKNSLYKNNGLKYNVW